MGYLTTCRRLYMPFSKSQSHAHFLESPSQASMWGWMHLSGLMHQQDIAVWMTLAFIMPDPLVIQASALSGPLSG